jgi:hypothetical protein
LSIVKFLTVGNLYLGYIAAASEPKIRPSLFKAIRAVLIYGILIILILNIVSALNGGMYLDILMYVIYIVFSR